MGARGTDGRSDGRSELGIRLWEASQIGRRSGWVAGVARLTSLTSTISSTARPGQTELCSQVYPGRPHESRVLREVQPEWGVAGEFVYVSGSSAARQGCPSCSPETQALGRPAFLHPAGLVQRAGVRLQRGHSPLKLCPSPLRGCGDWLLPVGGPCSGGLSSPHCSRGSRGESRSPGVGLRDNLISLLPFSCRQAH